MTNGCCCELSWTTAKGNVDIDTTNESDEKGRDSYFHKSMLAVVRAKHISIKNQQFPADLKFS